MSGEAIRRVAIIGFGRFGRALGELLFSRQIGVRGYDPHIEDDPRLSPLPEALAGADLVVCAVPVGALEAALEAARPYLSAEQVVIDVGSVKTGPTAQLAACCGAAIPWVATHPLFGPDSLAAGDSISAVVCPNDAHPQAVERVCDFYRFVGCSVRRQSPEDHDRLMAETHALTYFIAKALVDLGIDRHVEAAPPSFRALARTIETVRADAGHLVGAIQRENPFADDARARLIEALSALDARIRESSEWVGVPPK